MVKRKCNDGDVARMTEFYDSAKRRKKRVSEAGPADKANMATGSSKDAFRAEWSKASDDRKAALAQVEAPEEVQIEKHSKRKKRKKRKAHHHPEAVDFTDAVESQQPAATTAPNPAGRLDLDPSQLPEGLSRHQRRRWRRKLIRENTMSKDLREDSASDVQYRSSSKPSTRKRDDVAWADKPIGRAAMARRFATTSLMQPPGRRWVDRAPHATTAPTARTSHSTPWQRSAVETGHKTLPQSSVGAESDLKSVVSGAAVAPDVAQIRTPGLEDRGSPRSIRRIDLKDDMRTSLSSAFATPARIKRPSYGNKANSVPTNFVDGDIAERFRRFSAAAHGKAVENDSDESSERSSGSDENNESEMPGKPPARAREDDGAQVLLPRKGNFEHADEASTSGEYDGLIPLPELMLASARGRQANVGIKRTIFGSEVGGGRSSTPAAERDKDDSQISVFDAAQSTAPLAPIDEAFVDVDEVMDEILRDRMQLTRELPPGKRAPRPNPDLDREDGLLTQDSSDRRVTRSASKAKPAMLHKRMDSAIPNPGSEVVLVRSMRLPEKDGNVLQGTQGRGVAGNEETEGTVPTGSDLAGAQPSPANARRRSSSPLSELSQSPSPLQKRSSNRESPITSPRQQAASEGDDGDDTIVVAVPEQAEEPKKKRKMTGRTSKHFSTPKSKKTRSKVGPETAQNAHTASTPDRSIETQQDQSGTKRKRSLPTKDLLAETRILIDDVPPPTGKVFAQRPKKRSRRSSGTLANLTDANIIESRSRSSGGKAQVNDQSAQTETGNPSAGTLAVEPAVEGDLAENVQETASSQQRKKRSRRENDSLANLDVSNMIESQQRRSKDKSHGQINNGLHKQEVNVEDAPADESNREESKPKKRQRRSGGKITDLDTSNILESRARKSRTSADANFITAEDLDKAEADAGEELPERPPAKAKAKRKSTGKRSVYFIPPKPPLDPTIDRVDYYNTTARKKRAPAGVSTAPVPSIHSDRFGIIQEKLWREPFWLLIAVTFLNKTTGRAAAPIFWKLKDKYATPEALAAADEAEILDLIWHLGLQRQRSARLLKMAKAWVERAPERGVRWRKLHYPVKGDGKEWKDGVAIEEDADDVAGAIEIGRIPGTGDYACDSWRIFCRDVLRGIAEDYTGKGAQDEGFVPEWQKVLPDDKELRACLRWMWLREGWIWNHETGDKRRATEGEMERAVLGEMDVPDAQEGKFAAQAAGVDVVIGAKKEVKAQAAGEESEMSALPPSSEQEAVQKSETRVRRIRKRAATPEQDDAGSSDNIVVSPPARKRRTSGRTPAARTLAA